MGTYIVGYDLNQEAKNYAAKNGALTELIKEESNGTWWHHLDSTWIIISNKNPVQLRDRFMTVLDHNDELLVIAVSVPAAWYGFNESGSKWLKEQL